MDVERVLFYSSTDINNPRLYERMESVVKDYEDGKKPEDINDYLEMYHIMQFAVNRCCPSSWSEERLNGIKLYRKEIVKFFSKIDVQTIVEQYEVMTPIYRKTIWKIVDAFKFKNLITEELLQTIVAKESIYLRDFLEYKWIVERNGSLMAKYLKINSHTAEWLLDQFVADKSIRAKYDLFFPEALSMKDRDGLVHDYVNSADANLNYVRMVLAVKQNNSGLSLSPQTLKDARYKETALCQMVLGQGIVQHYNIAVSTTSDKHAPERECKENKNGVLYVYNRNVIDEGSDAFIPYYCAIDFEMLTSYGFIRRISKASEAGLVEFLKGTRAKNTYLVSSTFKIAEYLSILQMKALNYVLHDKGRSMESVIKYFYEKYLDEKFGYKGMALTLPHDEKDMIVRIRNMAIEMDAVAHQYDCYIENGSVDRDLVELTSPKKITETRSLIDHRYCVLNKENDDVCKIIRLFFSNPSTLTYVEPCRNMNLENLCALIEKGIMVRYDSYEDYQKSDVDYLIDKGYLSKDDDGYLKCDKMIEVGILKHLYDYGACAYLQYALHERAILDDMEDKGWITWDCHLLSPAERDYFSYYLNNERFTNGPAIRNNYAHGTTPSCSEEKHEMNYYYLQMLFVLLLLKISEDLNIKSFLEEPEIE